MLLKKNQIEISSKPTSQTKGIDKTTSKYCLNYRKSSKTGKNMSIYKLCLPIGMKLSLYRISYAGKHGNSQRFFNELSEK